jgi:hypothetical protein
MAQKWRFFTELRYFDARKAQSQPQLSAEETCGVRMQRDEHLQKRLFV